MLATETVALHENKAICAAMSCNLIYTIDINSGEIEIIDSLPEEDILSKRLVGSIEIYQDIIIFIPFNAKKIWLYNYKTKIWKGIALRYERQPCKFWSSYLYEDRLYLIPSRYPALVKIDLKTGEIEEKNDCIVVNDEITAETGYFFSDYVVDEEELVLASCASNHMLRYNYFNDSFIWVEVGNSINKYVGLTSTEDAYWFAPRKNSSIVKYSKGVTKEFSLPESFDNSYHFLGIEIFKDIVIYGIDGQSIVIDPKTEKLTIRKDLCGYSCSKWLNQFIHFEAFLDGTMVVYNKNNETCTKVDTKKLDINDFVTEKCGENYLKDHLLTTETEQFSLFTFLNLM